MRFVFASLMVSLLASGLFVTPRAVYAQASVPANVDPQSSPLTALSTIATDVTTAEDLVQNLLEWAVELADEKLRSELIDWLIGEVVGFASGDGGSPKFITDWFAFLEDAGINAEGQVANLLADAKICETFRKPLLQSVGASGGAGGGGTPFDCSLEQITDPKKFAKNFNNGGWDAYVASLQPENSFISSFVMARQAQQVAASQAKEAAQAQAVSGGGFLGDIQGGLISTPGSIIKDLTSKGLGAKIDHILNADSLGEYLSALGNSLIVQVMENGLAQVSRQNGGNSAPGGGNAINKARFTQEKRSLQRDLKDAISLRQKGQSFYDNASASISVVHGKVALSALEYLRDELYLIDSNQDLNGGDPACGINFTKAKRLQNRILPDIEDMVKEVENIIDSLDQAVDNSVAIYDPTDPNFDVAALDFTDNVDLIAYYQYVQLTIKDLDNDAAGRQTLAEFRGNLGGSIVVESRRFENHITDARKRLGKAYDLLTEEQNRVKDLDKCTKHRSPHPEGYNGGTLPFSCRASDGTSKDPWESVPSRPFPWEEDDAC